MSDLYSESRLFGSPPNTYNSSPNSSRHNARVPLSGPASGLQDWRFVTCVWLPSFKVSRQRLLICCQLVRRLLFRGGNVLAKWRLHFTLSVSMHEQFVTDIQRVATFFCFALGCCWERLDCVLLFERFGLLYRTDWGSVRVAYPKLSSWLRRVATAVVWCDVMLCCSAVPEHNLKLKVIVQMREPVLVHTFLALHPGFRLQWSV